MGLGWSTFGVSLVSAFFPVVNIEAYLGVVASQIGPSRALSLALVAGLGQALGKLVWYEAARRGAESAWLARRLERPGVRARYDAWLGRAEGRPLLTTGVLLASSLVGLPPLLLAAPLAGAVHLPRWLFVATICVGRTAQFWVILTGVGHLFG